MLPRVTQEAAAAAVGAAAAAARLQALQQDAAQLEDDRLTASEQLPAAAAAAAASAAEAEARSAPTLQVLALLLAVVRFARHRWYGHLHAHQRCLCSRVGAPSRARPLDQSGQLGEPQQMKLRKL